MNNIDFNEERDFSTWPLRAFQRAIKEGQFNGEDKDISGPEILHTNPGSYGPMLHYWTDPFPVDSPEAPEPWVTVHGCSTLYPYDEVNTFPLLHRWPCRCGRVLWDINRGIR